MFIYNSTSANSIPSLWTQYRRTPTYSLRHHNRQHVNIANLRTQHYIKLALFNTRSLNKSIINELITDNKLNILTLKPGNKKKHWNTSHSSKFPPTCIAI